VQIIEAVKEIGDRAWRRRLTFDCSHPETSSWSPVCPSSSCLAP